MKCPYCSNPESRVVDSRPSEEGTSIRVTLPITEE